MGIEEHPYEWIRDVVFILIVFAIAFNHCG